MARVIAGPGAGFQGSVDDLSFYKMRGVEGTIVRRKGGPSKEQVKNAPSMVQTRRGNSEFAGRAKTAQWIMRSLFYHKSLADHNIAGPLNALMRPVQALDGESVLGQRDVRLSANPQILKGFSLNRNNPFDTAIRYPIEYVLDRDTATAFVQVPELQPGINLFAPEKYPWFSIVISLGIVPDLVFTKDQEPADPDYDSFTDSEARSSVHAYSYTHPEYQLLDTLPVCAVTVWHPVKKGCPAIPLDLQLLIPPPDNHFTLLLSIGIRYGIQEDAQTITQARYAGAAKILAVE
ncbi:hypothetical protein HB364_26975 [Pseudoflavitalea sp. X16]|uniref:hypothetical protein n=1 Tax=Paraflavitalea devenefica TaxID=2716334 RepID=UPI00141ED6FA|nr:hypothetical protein [Paraflavitalea devenefica]NII28754.1 hypothetical protein [Paraflavitalea devenefica]